MTNRLPVSEVGCTPSTPDCTRVDHTEKRCNGVRFVHRHTGLEILRSFHSGDVGAPDSNRRSQPSIRSATLSHPGSRSMWWAIFGKISASVP